MVNVVGMVDWINWGTLAVFVVGFFAGHVAAKFGY